MDAVDTTGRKFSIDELGVEQSRQEFINTIGDAPKAGLIFVRNYESVKGYGEVSDYFYLKGVNYGNMKDNSLAKLEKIENDPDFSIRVTRGVWIDSDGNAHNRKAKGREYRTVTEDFKHGDEPLVEAIGRVHKSLTDPRPSFVHYEKEANGVYENESDNVLHIRDCLLIQKNVKRQGDYPQKASGMIVALTNAIKRLLPISKYRQVKLDGRFDYISVGGDMVMQDETGSKAYVGFKEHAGLLEPRIHDIEDAVEQERQGVQETVEEMLD